MGEGGGKGNRKEVRGRVYFKLLDLSSQWTRRKANERNIDIGKGIGIGIGERKRKSNTRGNMDREEEGKREGKGRRRRKGRRWEEGDGRKEGRKKKTNLIYQNYQGSPHYQR